MNESSLHTIVGTAANRFRTAPPPLRPGGAYERIGLVKAKVVAVNYARHQLDCLGVGTAMGGAWRGVPVLSSAMTQREGLRWLPVVTTATGRGLSDSLGELVPTDDRDCYCYLAFVDGEPRGPVCVGFAPPVGSQLDFDEPGTYLRRHASDSYARETQAGTYERVFADGTYLKIAPPEAGTGLTPLDGRNVDAPTHPWAIPVQPARVIHLSHPSGTTMTIDQDGVLTISAAAGSDIALGGVALAGHTHEYEDDNGTTTPTKTTGGPQ